MARDAVRDAVMAHLEAAQDSERIWKEKFHDNELMYLMKYKRADVATDDKKTKQQKSTRSMQYVGYAHAQIETGGSKLNNMLFGLEPPFAVDPMGGTTLDEARAVKELHRYSFRKDRVKRKVRESLRYVLTYGVVVLKHTWEDCWVQRGERVAKLLGYVDPDQPDKIYEVDALTAESLGLQEKWGSEVVRKPFLTYAGPCTRIVDPYYFHIDPDAGTIPEARWVQEEFTVSADEVKRKIKDGTYDNVKLSDVDFHTNKNGKEIDYRKRRREAANMPFDDERNTASGADETQTGIYDLIEEWHDDRIVTLIGRTNPRILRDRPYNPFFHGNKPYTSLHYLKLPNEFWSISMAKQLEGPQHELNMIRRMRSDALPSRIDPMWRVSPELRMRMGGDTLQWRPNGTIEAQEGEIEPLIPGELPIFSYNEERIIREDGDLLSGITDIVRGSAAASTTATVGTLNANFAADRLSDIVDSLSEGMEDMLAMRHALYGQFGSEMEVIAITGSEGPTMVHLPIQVVRKNYLFRFTAGKEAAKSELRRNQFMQAATIVSQNPALMLRTNFDTLLHDFWLGFDIHDPSRYILAEGSQNLIAQFLLKRQLDEFNLAANKQAGPTSNGDGGSGGKDSPKRASTPMVSNNADLLSSMTQDSSPKVRGGY
jgi:hypothetical protein